MRVEAKLNIAFATVLPDVSTDRTLGDRKGSWLYKAETTYLMYASRSSCLQAHSSLSSREDFASHSPSLLHIAMHPESSVKFALGKHHSAGGTTQAAIVPLLKAARSIKVALRTMIDKVTSNNEIYRTCLLNPELGVAEVDNMSVAQGCARPLIMVLDLLFPGFRCQDVTRLAAAEMRCTSCHNSSSDFF